MPVIAQREILSRARVSVQREMEALAVRAAEEGLPESCYADERRALKGKLEALNAMLFYECGEYC